MYKINSQVRLLNGQLVTIVMKGEDHYNFTMWIGEPKQGGTRKKLERERRADGRS
jgi:hypothetical protein